MPLRLQRNVSVGATRTIAQVLASSGASLLAWRSRRQGSAHGRALVLMYHRISDQPDYLGLSVPAVKFDRQLELLRRRTRVMPLRELVERLRRPEALHEDIAAITFDDGYRDNLMAALPILERHGLSATVFVATGFVDGTARPAGERLLAAFEALWRQHVPPTAWDHGEDGCARAVRAALARPGSLRALRKLRLHLKHLPFVAGERLLMNLEQLAGTPGNGAARMLDWNDARTLNERGIEIASHTVSHAILTSLAIERVEQELRVSKERLEQEIGSPVVGFAFPNGSRNDFRDEHISLLGRLGYEYACTAVRGANHPGDDMFRIRRIGVGADPASLLDLKLALAGRGPCAA